LVDPSNINSLPALIKPGKFNFLNGKSYDSANFGGKRIKGIYPVAS
jgi:hypothetical protein